VREPGVSELDFRRTGTGLWGDYRCVIDDILSVIKKGSGLATAAELRNGGLSRKRFVALVRTGELVPLARGVYTLALVVRNLSDDPARLHALTVAAAIRLSPGLVASHESAARIHRIDVLSSPGIITPELTFTRPLDIPSSSARGGARVRSADLPAAHTTSLFGVPLTTRARTVVDIARSVTFIEGVVAVDSALRDHPIRKEDLDDITSYCQSWPGIKQARQVVAFSDPLAESPLESAARVIFDQHGLPRPELQVHVIGVHRTVVGRVDFLWREANVIAEADGDLKYEDPEHARRQLTRDRLLHEAGFDVVHFTWRELFFEPTRVIARIREALGRGAVLRSARHLPRVRVPKGPPIPVHFGLTGCTNPGEDDFQPVSRRFARWAPPAARHPLRAARRPPRGTPHAARRPLCAARRVPRHDPGHSKRRGRGAVKAPARAATRSG